MSMIFIESIARPIQSISQDVRLLGVFPLCVDLYSRGMETSCQKGSSLNFPNKNWQKKIF